MENMKKYDWLAPADIPEYAGRLFAIRPLVLFLIFSALSISELRFDWVEQTVGDFLVSTNTRRPESGTIWETGNKTRTAQKNLDKLVSDRQTSQQEIREAESFKEIASTIQPDQWVMIPPDHFRRLYLKLEPKAAEKIISAFDLLKLINQKKWDRSYFEKDGDGLVIYLLDADNRVLKQLPLAADLLGGMGESQVETDLDLDNLPRFENRIFPADHFFKALDRLDDQTRNDIIPQPGQLLRIPGQIVRVAVSDEVLAGYIELGFEIETGSGRVVILMNGHEWAVRQLIMKMGGPSPVWPKEPEH